MADEQVLRDPADRAQARLRRDTSILAVALCAMSWLGWYSGIRHHWAGINNHFVAVAFLVMLPFPCISVFVRSLFKSQGFTPTAALYTYTLLLLAGTLPPSFL